MIFTHEQEQTLMRDYFAKGRVIALKITNECPLACAHCREFGSMDNHGVMSKEVIDAVISQIAESDSKKWVVCLQGGEAILYPELCKYTIDRCKEIGIMSNLYTSGWWVKDVEKYVKMILDMDPDIFCLSVNDWTAERMGGIDYANTIAKYFAPDDVRPFLIYSECYLDEPKYGELLDVKSCIIPYQIALVGRATNLAGTYIAKGLKENWMSKSICTHSGFEIGVDGTIYPNCCAASATSCRFGNVINNKVGLSQLVKSVRQKRRCNGY